MDKKDPQGWRKILAGYPWFNCKGCFPISAYSEFMPPPRLGCKPYGKADKTILSEDDPFGWIISEIEEENELKPGIGYIGKQIMKSIVKLGKGIPHHYISGHNNENLENNPYWPQELASHAGNLIHERYVTLLPMMLSRTQDDKGRIIWTFFGNSIDDPEIIFWKGFFTGPGTESDTARSIAFFTGLISSAYGEDLHTVDSLFGAGFRIMPSGVAMLPRWAKKFTINNMSSVDGIRYLLTFIPFASLPATIRNKYLDGNLSLLPFPGSLVFWGMPGYVRLKKALREAGQIPLLNLVARKTGAEGLRVTQAGWLHEPGENSRKQVINENLIHTTYDRTHRWQKVHKYQDELNVLSHNIKLTKALFSTEPDAMGLYDKPLARNSQIWNDKFELLLDGMRAGKRKITETEKKLIGGGLFGFRFFYPPMQLGDYEIYLNRPLVAFVPDGSCEPVIKPEALTGYFTCYRSGDPGKSDFIELWPRLKQRDLYNSALLDYNLPTDHYRHQTSFNIITLLDCVEMQNGTPLDRSFAHHLLNISKHKSLEEWIGELDQHTVSEEKKGLMKLELEKIIAEHYDGSLPEALTFNETASRQFEENWWNDIRCLAQGEFIYKDNADIMLDDVTLSLVQRQKRDLDILGDYLLSRYNGLIKSSDMHVQAIAGELAFKWKTLFDFPQYGGWLGNQHGNVHERNILVIIPGKNRKQAVILADHYDTAYMEDIYEKERGGSGARLAARGADDNYSASATLLQAAPLFLKMSKEGRLERDIWLLHLTGEEFPSDCMGARNFCQSLIEKNLILHAKDHEDIDISGTEIKGVYVMDMIGHNRDNDQDIFQISPGKSRDSLFLAYQAHLANMIWNNSSHNWNKSPERSGKGRGERISDNKEIPEIARHPVLKGEIRTKFNPHSSLFNTDGQIFSDVGVPVVLFMENYDINRTGYHDTKDTMENIDLDYGSALAAIAIETVARMATLPVLEFS